MTLKFIIVIHNSVSMLKEVINYEQSSNERKKRLKMYFDVIKMAAK